MILKEIEERILSIEKEINVSYCRSGAFSDNVIAKIQLELMGWRFRQKANHILDEEIDVVLRFPGKDRNMKT